MISYKFLRSIFFSFLLLCTTAHFSLGADGSRDKNTIGVFATILSGPFYTGSIGWNALSFLRLSAGYGQQTYSTGLTTDSIDIKVSIIDIGAKLLVPGWSLSPFLGGEYILGSATAEYQGVTYTSTADGIALSAGLDYQAHFGLNIGLAAYLGKSTGVGGYLGFYF